MTDTDHAREWARHYLRVEAGPRLAEARKAERQARVDLVDALKASDLGRAFATAHAAKLRVAAEIEAANEARVLVGESIKLAPPTSFVERLNNVPEPGPVIDPLAQAVEQLAAELAAQHEIPRSIDELEPDKLEKIVEENASAHNAAETDPLARLEFNGAPVETYAVELPIGITLTAKRNVKTGEVVYLRNGTVVSPGQVTREHQARELQKRKAAAKAKADAHAQELEAKKAARRWDG